MTRTLVRLAAVAAGAAGAAVAAGPAAAQPPAPGGPGAYDRPVFSPYLNLVNGLGSPAFNYFGIVRPQVQGRQAILGLENSVLANQRAITGIQQGIAGGEYNQSATGHPTQFLNTGGYFLNSGGPGGTAGGGSGPRQAPAGFGMAASSRGGRGRGATGMQSVGGGRRR